MKDNKKERHDDSNNNVAHIESWLYDEEGKLLEHTEEQKVIEWVNPEDDPITHTLNNNIGIGSINDLYIEVNPIQDCHDEYAKILRFLKKYLEYYSKKKSIPAEELNIEFINYGKTELVYVLTEKNGYRQTLLVKQPALRFGDVYNEKIRLDELSSKYEWVIKPIEYFSLGDQELYATPYINQARCVASFGTWGMYIPEPFYRFQNFNAEQEDIVTTCMIAKLVSLYDFEKNEGIGFCKLGGGDFMLPKGWEHEKPTIENTLNALTLIAARSTIECGFEEYLIILKDEFSRSTIADNSDELLVNIRGRVPMKLENIEAGIKLGRKLIKQNTTRCRKLDNK